MINVLQMHDVDLAHKRVLIRQDLNVPIKNGKINSDARILASIPTINRALKHNAKVMLMSHLGRPCEGSFDINASLQPIADHLSKLLDRKVRLIRDWIDTDFEVMNGEVVLFENVRFNCGEKSNDDLLSKKMANLCDVFVMDAFGTAHRAQASTCGVAKYAPISCAGPLLVNELEALRKSLKEPAHPMLAIVGGAKVSSKLNVLESLSTICDQLIVGGGIANTFIKSSGHEIGKSLCEDDLITVAKNLINSCSANGAVIPIPEDVVTAKEFSENSKSSTKVLSNIEPDDMILDFGPKSTQKLCKLISEAATIVWNGPLGVFEFENFSNGTKAIAQAIAESNAFSIAGGGDTLAAIEKFQVSDKISYISTGGGAFLEFLEGKVLPAVAVLEERAIQAKGNVSTN